MILEKRRLDLDAARRDYNKLEQKRVKKSENNVEPPAELIIQIQAKETALNGEALLMLLSNATHTYHKSQTAAR